MAFVADEQLDSEIRLKLLDLPAQRRLCNVQMLGRLTKIQLLGHREKVANVTQFHDAAFYIARCAPASSFTGDGPACFSTLIFPKYQIERKMYWTGPRSGGMLRRVPATSARRRH